MRQRNPGSDIEPERLQPLRLVGRKRGPVDRGDHRALADRKQIKRHGHRAATVVAILQVIRNKE